MSLFGNMLLQNQPIYAIFNFIGIIITCCMFLFHLGCELMTLFIIIIYIGAIAVLFLFLLFSFPIIYNVQSFFQKFRIIVTCLFAFITAICFYYYCIVLFLKSLFMKLNSVNFNLIEKYNNLQELQNLAILLYNDYTSVTLLYGFILIVVLFSVIIFVNNEKIRTDKK